MITIGDWAAVIAAGIALVGVLCSMLYVAARERKLLDLTRRDAYRTEARSAVAGVLRTAADYQRTGRIVSDTLRWVSMDYESASELARATEAAMAKLGHDITATSMLVSEPDLQAAIGSLDEAFDNTAAAIHASVDAFWGIGGHPLSVAQRERFWNDFDSAIHAFLRAAKDTLRSPVEAL